ncbi:MAG: GntR family transcriptional regulator [Thermoleophilia bacterium]|nr:GntR family transcriptional regulator [Thermoleophilia bacterium]
MLEYWANRPDRHRWNGVAAALVSRIQGGRYSTGERLPPERELAEEFGVARLTLRRAWGHLRRGGTSSPARDLTAATSSASFHQRSQERRSESGGGVVGSPEPIAVLRGGNGGLTLAGILTPADHKVNLFELPEFWEALGYGPPHSDRSRRPAGSSRRPSEEVSAGRDDKSGSLAL